MEDQRQGLGEGKSRHQPVDLIDIGPEGTEEQVRREAERQIKTSREKDKPGI